MQTPPSEPVSESQNEVWILAGRSIRSFAHEVNNHLGAVLAYAELIAAHPESGAEARRMAVEISAAARDSAARLDVLTALVSSDLATVDTIHFNEMLLRLSTLFRFELERGGSGLEILIPKTVCAFAGVRARIVRALVHTLRHAADRALAARTSRKITLRLTRESDKFIIEITGPALDSAAGDMEFPGALAEAREHLRYHDGELRWAAPGSVRLEVPCDTGLVKRTAAT